MKKIIYQISILIAITIMIVSCDKVKDVRDPNAEAIKGNRKVFVEDYTGHKCGNCPAAADTLKYLTKKYPGQVVALAIHAGFFANINASYPTDLRNPVSTAYDNVFGVSLAGNPNGLINRGGFGTGGFIKAYSTWEGEVAQMLSRPAKFEIKIRNTFTTSNNNLNTSITVKSLTNNAGIYKLVVLLSEDSIIAEQLDYRLPSGSQLIPDYEFNHVLREAVNSSFGDPIFTSGAVANDSAVKAFPNYSINSAYNASKCHIIAYVYDADPNSPTYYEVLQVEEAHVK
ncbi:MAG: Omp28 family outer membrane lipoprotein [Bacteroidetes bacterium]|nr:Omp28 family outer membrane lipoprotein [Bacteroidota bacterium]